MPEMPADPVSAAASSLTANAVDAAGYSAERRARTELMKRLPRIFHPLVRGGSRPIGEQYREMASQYFWGLIFSAFITLALFAVFGVGLLVVAGIVLYAVVLSM